MRVGSQGDGLQSDDGASNNRASTERGGTNSSVVDLGLTVDDRDGKTCGRGEGSIDLENEDGGVVVLSIKDHTGAERHR